MISRKIPWTSQPQYPVQIDWSNPLTRGLVGLFDSVNSIDLVDNGFPSTNSVTQGVVSKGRIANFSNSAQIYPHKPRYAVTGALTIFTPLVVTSLANYSGILSKSSDYSTFPFELRLGASPTTSEINFERGGGGTASAFKGSGSLISANPGVVQYLVVRCISGDINIAPDVFVNKAKTTLGRNGYATITGTASDNGSALRVGNRFDTTTYLNGGIQYLGLWNRALSDSEILSLSDNPWQIFKSQSRRIFVASAAGGTVWNVSVSESITLADTLSSIAAFQSAQAESIALVDSQSVTNLAVASLSEAMTLSDTPSAGTVTGASIAEAITLAESVSSSALYAVSLAEALTLADAVTSALTAAASVAEAIALSEAASVTADFNVSIAESVALADSSSTSGQVTSADITESIALADALTASALFTTAVAESISLADVLTAAAQFQAAITEAMALVDSSSTSGLVLSAAIVESMSLIDAWSATA